MLATNLTNAWTNLTSRKSQVHRPVLANALGTKLIRKLLEVPSEVLDSVDLRSNRSLGEVTALQLFNHELT